MAQDPRSTAFKVVPCNTQQGDASTAGDTAGPQAFYSGINKVGDLQVLNSTGSNTINNIGLGLRTLSSVSNSVRTGCGALPTSIGSAVGASLNTGANWVLQNVGFAPQVIDSVRAFNPAIANQAYGQAKQIFEKVQQGKFHASDIPSSFQDFQNLERLARNIYTPKTDQSLTAACQMSPYAVDLVNRAPKYKFLFIVEFQFNADYHVLSNLLFPFVVKTSTRPHIRFEMEDVNYYNFRTKIITKTMFEEMTMTFHDDIKNELMTFMTAYLNASSPITNKPGSSILSDPEGDGMTFENILTDTFSPGSETSQSSGPPSGAANISIPVSNYSASRGPFAGDVIQPIQYINLHHVYDYGRFVNTYSFLNPRITSLQMDDVDMSIGNEGNQATVMFNYDSVVVALNRKLADIKPEDLTKGGIYPLRDVQTAGSNPPLGDPSAPGFAPPGGGCSPANTLNTSIPPVATPTIAA